MKKIALLLLSVLMLSMLLFGCEYNGEQSLDESDFSIFESSSGIVSTESSNDTLSAESTESTDFNKTRIKELETQIKNLRTELSEANSEKSNLSDKIKSLELEINKLKNSPVRVIKTRIKDGIRLIFTEDYTSQPYYTLNIEYADKTVVEVAKENNIWTVKASPEGTKVIYNDYEWEYNAHVWLYDVDKRVTRELLMQNLPKHTTVEDMEWLDDRYFLFIVQFDSGTIVRGGDVYIYDTKTDQYKAIVINKDNKFQTSDFDVYNQDFVIIHSYLYDDQYYYTEDKYHLLTHDEIYDLIKNNKTIDLSSIKGLSK